MLLETPYAFQENAAEISAKAKDYFGKRIGRGPDGNLIEIASYDTHALDLLRLSRWVMAPAGVAGLVCWNQHDHRVRTRASGRVVVGLPIWRWCSSWWRTLQAAGLRGCE